MPDKINIDAAGMIGILILAAALIVAPHVVSFSQQELLVLLTINVLVVTSYRLQTLTGEWSLAHVVMMGSGAYASALCSKSFGFPVPLAMITGAIVAGLIAALMSFPLFRMKGFYFLIGSFAAGEAIRLCWERFRVPFGGPKGLKHIPGPELGSLNFYDPIVYYSFTSIVVVICLVALYRLEKSRIGFTLHAIHWKDVLAESVGVNARLYRSAAFVIASFFAAISGGLLAHYIGTVTPDRFGLGFMLMVLVWAIVGGTATFAGPIIGVIILTVSDEMLRGFEEARPLIYGFILIVTIRFLPHGIEDLLPRLQRLLASRPSPVMQAESQRKTNH